jgi:hypothetical protein
MSWIPRRRKHWIIAAVCLIAVSLTTAAAVYREPKSKPAASAGALSQPGGGAASAAGAASAGGSAAAVQSIGPGGATHKVNFGLAYGDSLIGASQATITSSLDDAVILNVGYIRVDLPWDAIQTTGPGEYTWGSFDRIVDAAHARGLKVDAILDDPPYWARQTWCHSSETCPPTDFGTFAEFAATAAARYDGEVTTWEIWNEPNIGPWRDPSQYVEMLADTSAALRKVEPDAFIVLGGLAAVNTDAAEQYESAYDFLSSVAQLDGTRYVDAVGYHPYSLPELPSVAETFQWISSARDNLVAVLQKYGTPNIPIWLTETGAQVNQGIANLPPNQVATTSAEEAQAAYAVNLVQTVAANANVGAAFWYSDEDAPSSALYFGLRNAAGVARPAFSALQTAIANCGCNAKA